MNERCYNCHTGIRPSRARTIGQCVLLCPACYREMHEIIERGYFDVPTLEREMAFEEQVQGHISVFA